MREFCKPRLVTDYVVKDKKNGKEREKGMENVHEVPVSS